jgi:hypothetical protein
MAARCLSVAGPCANVCYACERADIEYDIFYLETAIKRAEDAIDALPKYRKYLAIAKKSLADLT